MRMRTPKTLFMTVLLCGVALTACQTTSRDNSGHMATGQGRSVSKAQDGVYQAQDPFANSMLVAARKAESEGRLQEAAVFLAKAYDRESDNPEIAWRYARLLRMNNRASQAVTLLTPYSVRKKVSSHVLREYAAALLQNADVAQAYTETQRLVDKDPDDPKAWNVAGVVADAYGRRDEAIAHFKQGLEEAEEHDERQRAILLNNMALALTKQGKREEAFETIQKALTGAQYYPQIKHNFNVIKAWPDKVEEKLENIKAAPQANSLEDDDALVLEGDPAIESLPAYSGHDAGTPLPLHKPLDDAADDAASQ